MSAPVVTGNPTIDAGKVGGQAMFSELYRLWMDQDFVGLHERIDHEAAFYNFFNLNARLSDREPGR